MQLYKGYVPTKDKKCLMPFKNATADELLSFEQVKNLPEYAGILSDETILVDVDDMEQSVILLNIVENLNLKCRVYTTSRGRHFLFKNTPDLVKSNRTKATLAVGLEADLKIGSRNSYEVLKYMNEDIVGLFVGILPGAGASIGAFVGYNEAKRMSKHKEEFGKGSIEGIAGPEAANNAVTGGSMIPLMTLGIPGSPVAAILLGALMIHGLQPGYKLFTEEADITYPIIFGFLLANVAMYFVGKVFVRLLRRVVDIPPAILNACIVVLVAVGGYSISNSINDLYIAAIFGLVGYFCRIGKFNTSALTLGLVLGTITEKGLRRSITMARGDIIGYYLARPACIILIVLIIASLFGPAFKKLLTRVKTKRG